MKIIILGATGNVGRTFLDEISSNEFLNKKEIVACATETSLGKKVGSGNNVLEVKLFDDVKIEKNDIVFAAIGSSDMEAIAERIREDGGILIDNSSKFRMDPEVPLIIPEVNKEEIANYKNKNIISNPNCSTIQMLVPLKPLHDKYKIKRIVVSTYQSVSGKGKEAMDELYSQTKAHYEAGEIKPKHFEKQISFNCIPKIGEINEDGETEEEQKMHKETKKILGEEIEVCATCVRVPVFNCHAESVNIEFETTPNVEESIEILQDQEGIFLSRNNNISNIATQVECSAEGLIFVSRLRKDVSNPKAMNAWIVSDNLRKGAALNAVQIAEILIKEYLEK